MNECIAFSAAKDEELTRLPILRLSYLVCHYVVRQGDCEILCKCPEHRSWKTLLS